MQAELQWVHSVLSVAFPAVTSTAELHYYSVSNYTVGRRSTLHRETVRRLGSSDPRWRFRGRTGRDVTVRNHRSSSFPTAQSSQPTRLKDDSHSTLSLFRLSNIKLSSHELK